MNHEHYIKRCLEISKLGIGTTRPNPSVGAVLVVDDRIIGEGFTSPYGGNHAEVNAISTVRDSSLLATATMYVTLEPCSHFGKTPPCADLIIKSEIKKVVIGCIDSNVLVAGKGVERLQNAGCEVIVGVLEKECKAHHKRFFTFQTKKRPFIILKWAQTLDAYVAPKNRAIQAPVWITKEVSRQLVHKWRSEEQAILVGTTTVLDDNPGLDVRYWKGEDPVRIVIDKELKISTNLKVYDGSVKTIFINERSTSVKGAIFFEKINFSKPIAIQICAVLFKHNIQSLIVEGGTKTIQTFIDENIWDEARVFSGEVYFNDGVNAPILDVIPTNEENIKGDILKTYLND
ncbi:bifunctional diaminohydroxyphosphoribosylaminopyrimidine deaminase/5-amino-6-(5-phosphoribosylamino)uracil reductase RibD [Flavobacteriaceae bacterium]|nr:bifunctional diaminohydroxyphosphoribosylaminopyrimidine deaminase/5-amino-6-(5-phosphoribosylamino)uracil reductase RibD [Flavobacteriaceae bacterium]MDB9780358.1 bifunctional diaminohydroxyphosphoribosylaminopyrimidine deaminase/5-amino-6-(5-phosphoribosylamino)uracil reductase RibD [Flavobacteriaceae bacterium]